MKSVIVTDQLAEMLGLDYQEITTLIGSFGFPIVMCLLLFWYIVTTHKELVNALYAINRTLKAVSKQLDMEDEEDAR